MNRPEITVGTILNHSIGCGCNEFYQVVSRSDRTATARELARRATKRNLRLQTCDIQPIPGRFLANGETVRLRLTPERIGPRRRFMWWSVWKGERPTQFSS